MDIKNILKKYESYLNSDLNIEKNTKKAYLNDINKFLNNNKNIPITEKMQETYIINYINKLEINGYATSTINRNLSSIRSFSFYLLSKGYIKKDPTLQIKTKEVKNTSLDILSLDEISLLMKEPDINTLKGARDKAMMELVYSTGMEINEVISLDIENIDLELGFITVGNSKNLRTVPIGNHARTSLKHYLSNYRENIKDGALFINSRGYRISRQSFWKNLKEYGEKIGKDITGKTLRDSFIIHMLDNGASIETIQQMLGNKDIGISKLYYKNKNINFREDFKLSHPRA